MSETLETMVARIDENVIHLKNSLTDHIEEDRHVRDEFLRPLWEKHQQDKGAERARNFGGMLIGYAINAAIACATAWAAVEALAK